MTEDAYRPPRIAAAQLRLLERLCNASAVSGDEGEVRTIVLEQIKLLVSDVRVDALGNILAILPGVGATGIRPTSMRPDGTSPRPRVMLAAHMDEIGFMLVEDEGDGIFRFETVGGIDPRQLAGKPVWVGRKHVPGVIGVKPVHLTTPEERKKPFTLDALRIDIGPDNAKSAKIGDRAVFATSFARLGPSLRAKALDNCLGVAALIELLRLASRAPLAVDILAAFTVQEEIGLRGARVAAYALDPDLAIVLDCTPARDLPSWEATAQYHDPAAPYNASYNTRLDGGPAIYMADATTLSDPRLVRHLVDTAQALGIPYQIRQPGGGGTDAGAIHKQRLGIPSVTVSVPGRYAHTAASLARLDDWKGTLALVHAALTRLP
jgi:putative aminopeptidase FrvX